MRFFFRAKAKEIISNELTSRANQALREEITFPVRKAWRLVTLQGRAYHGEATSPGEKKNRTEHCEASRLPHSNELVWHAFAVRVAFQ